MNPSDNQGVRYHLVHWLLREGRTDEAGALLYAHDEEAAFWAYARALWRFQQDGDRLVARRALKDAILVNRHVVSLIAQVSEGEGLPDFPRVHGIGDENEAGLYLYVGGLKAWARTEGALDWLWSVVEEIVSSTDADGRRRHAKVGRNDPCPCGSGRKYKQCCMPR